RDALKDAVVALGVLAQGGGVVGGDIAGGDGVDVDAPMGPFAGEQAGDAGQPAFGGRVGRHANAALEGQHRGDVDDLAGAIGQHAPRGCLREEEGCLEIEVHHRVPILFGEVDGVGTADGAGIV